MATLYITVIIVIPNKVRHLIHLIGLVLLTHTQLVFAEESKHESLRGLTFLHMQIGKTFDDEVTRSELLDLNDIMELQLRRGAIDVRPYIANRPELNVPILVLSIDTSERLKTGQFDLVLQVRDRVTINRNKSEVVATTYELRRSGRAESNEVETIKQELREIMAEFVDLYREQNPLRYKIHEKE